MRNPSLFFAVTAAVGVLSSAAQQSTITRLDGSKITSPEIDATVIRVRHAAEATGAGLAIFDKGRVVYLKTYGVRDKEKNLPLTENSVMTAASFSKVAFAYRVMQFVDKNCSTSTSLSTSICRSRCRNIRCTRIWPMTHAISESPRERC